MVKQKKNYEEKYLEMKHKARFVRNMILDIKSKGIECLNVSDNEVIKHYEDRIGYAWINDICPADDAIMFEEDVLLPTNATRKVKFPTTPNMKYITD